MKALILAAGMGTRLRPITLHRPKPLCTVFGIELLDLAFQNIISSGIKAIAVNTHYLHKAVEQHLEKNDLNIEVISFEQEIRGTGGSIYPLKKWLNGQDLLIYNGDILSTISLSEMIEKHNKSRSFATMALLDETIQGKNPVLTDGDSIKGFGNRIKKDCIDNFCKNTFAGIHILSHAMIEEIPHTVPWDIIDSYQIAIEQKKIITSYNADYYWADLGTPQAYWKAHIDLTGQNLKIFNELRLNSLRVSKGLSRLMYDQSRACVYPYDWSPGLNQRVHKSVITHDISSQRDLSLSECLVLPEVRSLSGTYDQSIIGWDIVEGSNYSVLHND